VKTKTRSERDNPAGRIPIDIDETPSEYRDLHADDGRRIDDSEIASLAYQYWQERGCPDEGSEDDWYRARQELTTRRAGSGTTGA